MAPFAFGKLPAHGDFVGRGSSPIALAAWDAWASEGLEHARSSLGDSFGPAHEAAPAWRFLFADGRFGPGWRAGAFAPSIDRSGRRFIFVLGVEGEGGEVATRADSLSDALEDGIYRALGEGLDIDALIAGLDLPQQAQAEPALVSGRFWTLGGPNHRPQSLDAPEPPDDLILRALTPDLAPQ